MSRIFVTGATGLVGVTLVHHLAARGHELVILTRDERLAEGSPEGTKILVGEATKPGPWWEEVASCDAAVNLAGSPVVGRWSAEFKRVLRESRIETTKNLVAAIPAGKPFTLFSASAVGIYGDAGEAELDEDAPLGDDFLAKLAAEWEAEALKVKEKGARVIIGRFALVLGREGGVLQELFRNAKSYFDSTVGDGSQWVSWIHVEDLVDAITSLVESTDAEGVYNLVSPDPVRQGELATLVHKRLRSKRTVRVPRFMLKMMLGDFADNLLFSQKMRGKRLAERGFEFKHRDLKENLKTLL